MVNETEDMVADTIRFKTMLPLVIEVPIMLALVCSDIAPAMLVMDNNTFDVDEIQLLLKVNDTLVNDPEKGKVVILPANPLSVTGVV